MRLLIDIKSINIILERVVDDKELIEENASFAIVE